MEGGEGKGGTEWGECVFGGGRGRGEGGDVFLVEGGEREGIVEVSWGSSC